jgi:ADP-heptose:LPS heptosyltransferase
MPVIRSKVVSRKFQEARPEKIVRTVGLKDFYHKRNRILITRACGGLGDILMHRMMFEDFKRLMPDAEIHFCCPKYYHDALRDHPFIDRLFDVDEANRDDYIISYNTTTACGRAEMKLAPFSGPNRSDIWAAHCGLILTKHNMHIRMTDEEKVDGKRLLEEHRERPGPICLIAPVSAMQNKNLLEHQLVGLVQGVRERGLCPVAIHNTPIPIALKNDVPTVVENKLRRWMGAIDQADYVVSVDTSVFHCAGGMGKPLVGIFTFADGMAYGAHYDFFLVQRHRKTDPTWTCGPCYNWGACPKTKDNPKPCLTEITAEMILAEVDRMMAKWPMPNST